MKQPARKTVAPAKKKAPAKKAARKRPAKKTAPRPISTVDEATFIEVVSNDARRAPMRAAILLISLLATSAVCVSLVWWTLVFSWSQVRLAEEQNSRIVRLATAINMAESDLLPRIKAVEAKVATEGRDEEFMRRIVRFCILVQQANQGFVCPSLAEMVGPSAFPLPPAPAGDTPAS